MWRALRAELNYSRPYIVGGFGIAAGVVAFISVVFALVDDGPPSHAAAGIRGMFLVMAPLIVGFIIQSYRNEERRSRLLLAGPLTPRQLAFAMVLLPSALFGLGALAAGLVLGVEAFLRGGLEPEALRIAGFVGSQMFAYVQMGLLIQEATAARSQRRPRAFITGWAGFVISVLLLVSLYIPSLQERMGWLTLILGHVIVAVAIMVTTVLLYLGRTDFTR